jgi:hypothetical protein
VSYERQKQVGNQKFPNSVLDFVHYFEQRAAEIDVLIREDRLVTHEICKLITETVQNCSRELYFVLLRGLRQQWAPFVDVDEHIRNVEWHERTRLVRDGWAPYVASVFDLREMEVANEVGSDFQYIAFQLDKEVKHHLESIVRNCGRYSSLDSVLRHAVWRYICWMDQTELAHCDANLHCNYAMRLRQVEKDEYESHFYIAIEILNEVFSIWNGKGTPDLRWVRSHIQKFSSSYWRKRYLEEFDKYFGPTPQMSFGSEPRVKRVSLDPATFEEE